MFTGLVEDVGRIAARAPLPEGSGIRLSIAAPLFATPPALGDSIAVNGVCLTVVARADGEVGFDVGPETIERTTLGALAVGARVNLERAMQLGDRLGGHMVSGHIDAVATVVERQLRGDSLDFVIEVPAGYERYVIEKGSVCLDGISLTVNEVEGRRLRVSIIPHTQERTNLVDRTVGAAINLEVDLIAKYVERLLAGRLA